MLNIGVICHDAGNAATITDHIAAITHGSPHHAKVLPVWPSNSLLNLDFELFDALIIHYTIVAKDHTFLTPVVRKKFAEFTGLKVAFIQDEYRFINATIDALGELGIGLLFTCVPDGETDKVYSRKKLPTTKVLNVLTGYVPANLLGQPVPQYSHRRYDVGYRSRKVPMWLGELGWEKYRISIEFPEAIAAYRLRLDISCREEDRLYGQDWIRFTYNCKAFLGVESGASVFDFTGDIQSQVEAHQERDPNVTFEELQRLYFCEQEGKIRLNQISPRCFEAIALRTLLVLFEGEYSGILKPWRHFVPLKKDYSNIDEVAAVILDQERAGAIIDAAYKEVALNPKYSFDAFGKYVASSIESTILPEQRRLSDPETIDRAIVQAIEQGEIRAVPISVKPSRQSAIKRLRERLRERLRALRSAMPPRPKIGLRPLGERLRALRSAMPPRPKIGLRQLVRYGGSGLRQLVRYGGSGLRQLVRYGGSSLRQLVRYGGSSLKHVIVSLIDAVSSVYRTFFDKVRALLIYVRRKSRQRTSYFVCYRFLLAIVTRIFPLLKGGQDWRQPTVVFLHRSYYHFPLLARELRNRNWNAYSITLGDPNDVDVYYSKGGDLSLYASNDEDQYLLIDRLLEEMKRKCDIVHFSGVGMMRFSPEEADLGVTEPRIPNEFVALKDAGVRIGYSSVGCNDGISQSAWHEWTGGMCDKCRFQSREEVCSDIRNLAWGNKVAMFCDVVASELLPPLDYLGKKSTVHVPFAFCVDEVDRHPEIDIPTDLKIMRDPSEIIVLHAMGNYARRTSGNADPKGTRLVVEAIKNLQAEGLSIRLHFASEVNPNDMKYIQSQADIVVDQLYFGRYGATARESMMVGKPVVGFLKFDRAEETDESLNCLDECPIVQATAETLKEVLRDLAVSPEKRAEIGTRSREFALKWHSMKAAGDRFEEIWRERYQIGTTGPLRYH